MTGVTGKPELMKRMNTTLLYRTLIRLGSATRAEVAGETNLSATTIRNLFEELEAGGEIVAGAGDRAGGGGGGQRYALNSSRNLTLALYCAGGRIDYRITGLTGEVVVDSFTPLEGSDTAEAVLRLIADCRSRWDVRAIGLGVPGIVENGRAYIGSELDTLVPNDLGARVRSAFPFPLVLENDLNATALGYMNRYHREHPSCTPGGFNMAYIHFDRESAGAGVIANGQVVHGAKQFAGELGFLPMGCGQTLNDLLPRVSSREDCLDVVSRVVSIVNCVTNPELVVVGGSLFDAAWLRYALDRLNTQPGLSSPLRPLLLYCPDCREDYLAGLTALTLEELVLRLPLAASS